MDSFSKLFDKIRVKPDKETVAREQFPRCEWDGCQNAGAYRAPKGRGREGQYHHFCLDHVQLYNKSYIYFSGMRDDDIVAYQKDAMTGHRPTWNTSVNRWGSTDPNAGHHRPTEPTYNDPFGVFHGSRTGDGATFDLISPVEGANVIVDHSMAHAHTGAMACTACIAVPRQPCSVSSSP